MRRTAARPLPTGTLKPAEVLLFGVVTCFLGVAWLALAVNLLAVFLVALITSLSYLGLYTPLKTRTTLATAVGAIPCALPPRIGLGPPRTARFHKAAGLLLAILFVWQFPYFMAIAWMYREDYRARESKCFPWWTLRVMLIPPDRQHVRGPCAGKPAAFGGRNGRNTLFLWRSRVGHDFAASFAVG